VPFKGAAPVIKHMDWSSANGKILFSSGVLETIKPDGSDFKMIVRKEGGYCLHATWSTDGKQILYAFMPPSLMDEDIAEMVAKGLKPGLYVANADGSSDRLLIENGVNGTWSPDGKQIVYQTITRKTTPDERKTELYRNIFYTSDIYIINIDGTGKRLLVEGNAAATPAWSPDGKWILYHTYSGWFVISPDGSVKKKAKPPINDPPRWSLDGKKILGDYGYIADFVILENYDVK
jgi:Tol biopolymer transport system component